MLFETGAFVGNNKVNNAAVCWNTLRASSTFFDVTILKIGQSAGNLEIIFIFKKALRDCTPHAQTVSAVGDETVQTTTPV